MRSVPAFLRPLLLVSIAQAFAAIYRRNVPVDNRTLAQIYAAAQLEDGLLNIAWGGDANSQGAPVAAAFEAAFPAIKVNLTVDVSKYHDSRINRNFQQHNNQNPDVVALQTIQDFDDWKAEGHLLAYKPPTWPDFWPQFKDNEGYHMAFTCLSFGQFIYDNTKVAPADVPTSYADLLLPKWKSKMVVTYPNDDDAVTDTFRLIIKAYGWEWFEAFIAQDIQWVRGTQTPAEVILSNGTRILSISTFPIAEPLSEVAPAKDEFLIWPQTISIFSATTRPETAKLWIAWLTSDAVQNNPQFASLSARSDIGSSVFSIPNADPTDFHRFMSNRKDVEQWRLQYETSLGTAQGPSPLTFA